MDIIAQYWELLAGPNDSRSGDYGYSDEDLKKFGSNKGYDVYSAIEKAADRNVNVRYIESGFGRWCCFDNNIGFGNGNGLNPNGKLLWS